MKTLLFLACSALREHGPCGRHFLRPIGGGKD